MTVLLFAIDFVRERTGVAKLENKELSMHFDEDNITTPEEILMTKMEQLLLKRAGPTNPFNDKVEFFEQPETDQIYLNEKEQLVRIIRITRANGKEFDSHSILSFDVSKLPQASQHKYVGEDNSQAPTVRAKVPVKDGRSQSVSQLYLTFAEIHLRIEGNTESSRQR